MGNELTAVDVMQKQVRSVAPNLPVVELEKLLIEERMGGVPVVDGDRLVGIVSRSDIVRHLTKDSAAQAVDTGYWWDLGGSTAETRATGGEPSAGARLFEQALADLSVSDLMVTEIICVAPTSTIGEVARVMDSRRVHRVLVVDGETLHGVITTMDLTRLLADGRAVARSD